MQSASKLRRRTVKWPSREGAEKKVRIKVTLFQSHRQQPRCLGKASCIPIYVHCTKVAWQGTHIDRGRLQHWDLVPSTPTRVHYTHHPLQMLCEKQLKGELCPRHWQATANALRGCSNPVKRSWSKCQEKPKQGEICHLCKKPKSHSQQCTSAVP